MPLVENRTPYCVGSIDLIGEYVSAIVTEISDQFSINFEQNTHGETINWGSKSKVSIKLNSYFYAYPAKGCVVGRFRFHTGIFRRFIILFKL